MKKEWFVLNALVGQEDKAFRSIEARRKIEAMEDYVGKCVVPKERVSEKKNGRTRTITKKFFPGYVLCELALYDDAPSVAGKRAIVERTWQFVRETPGVTGFIGGNNPIPLKKSEVDAIMATGKAGTAEPPPRPKVVFNVNDTVKVNDGPFLGLKGIVSVVDPDKGKLKVEVSIFNRKVLVDVEYWQVEKVSAEELAATESTAG